MDYLKDFSKMDNLAKVEVLNQLFSIYYPLLTEKQITYFKMYYYENLSLQEIAEALNISRNAVFDQLKKVEVHLYDYEQKLSLYANYKKRNELLDLYLKTNDKKYLDLIRKLDE